MQFSDSMTGRPHMFSSTIGLRYRRLRTRCPTPHVTEQADQSPHAAIAHLPPTHARPHCVPIIDCQALLKAKYCPRVAPVVTLHESRPTACMQERHKNSCATFTLVFSRIREVVKVHVRTKFHHAKCSGSGFIMFTEFWRCWKQYCRRFRGQ